MSTSSKKSVLGLAVLTAFLDIVGFSIIFPLYPQMLEHYLLLEGPGGSVGRLVAALEEFAGDPERGEFLATAFFGGLLGSLYSILQFAFAPFWGGLSDRIGRRPTLVATLLGTCLSYVIWFFAGTFGLLVAARLFGGIMAGNISTATAVVADVTSDEDRSKGMGLIGAAIGLGFICGPAIGGLATKIDVLALWPGGEALGVNPFSGPALAAFLLSLGNFLFAWRRFPETRAATTPQTQRTANPLKLFTASQAPGIGRTNLIYFLFLLAFSAIEFTLTFLALERFAYGPMDNAWMFVFVGVVIALVQGGLLRRLAPRYGDRPLAKLGVVLVVPGFVLVGIATTELVLFAGLFAMAVGSALVMPTLGALASRYAPRTSQGLVLGRFRSMGALSRAIGPLLGGVLYWQLGSQTTYVGAAVFLVLPLLLAWRLPEPPGATA